MMITKYIPNTVTQKVGRALLHGQKNSPTILFVGGVAGVVTSTVLACRATLKLEEVLEETRTNAGLAVDMKHPDYTEEDRKKDLALIYIQGGVKMAKLYGPSFVLGVSSIFALTKSHNILNQRNAALTAAYAALDKGFREYRARVTEELGAEKEQELRYSSEIVKIEEEQKDGSKKKVSKKRVGPNGASVYARFFDEYSTEWSKTPEYNLIKLRCKQNYANDLLHSRKHLFLNEVYDELGIERSQAGAVVGWVVSDDGDNFVDFGVFDGDNPRARDFVNGREGSILLDFNVDGVIYDKI